MLFSQGLVHCRLFVHLPEHQAVAAIPTQNTSSVETKMLLDPNVCQPMVSVHLILQDLIPTTQGSITP